MSENPVGSNRCGHCGAQFATPGQLEDHLQRVHHDGNP
jgi:hypothetical protein